jgi:ATP-dependent Clp protease ATP-binding subunit ClpC
MFERFTDGARRVVVLAQEEAMLLNHNYIGTEHLLLGLIHEDEGVAARALQSLDVSLDAVRTEVREIIGEGTAPPMGHIPFTPRAKKVLELSLREALQLGHNYIGTEHILLGLVREGEGVAAQVLVKMAGAAGAIRTKVVELLAAGGEAQERLPGAELRVERPPEPEPEGPGAIRCPKCGAPLQDQLAFRVLPATHEDDEPDVRDVVVAYCGRCRNALGAWAGP